jgi:hypothetical protein
MNTTIGHKLPPAHGHRRDSRSVNALLRKLQPGDSVLLPRRLRDSIYVRAKRVHIQIATRIVDADTFRLWRTG